MPEDDTSIRISEETWHQLNSRKEPGVSFDDVITNLLEDAETGDSAA